MNEDAKPDRSENLARMMLNSGWTSGELRRRIGDAHPLEQDWVIRGLHMAMSAAQMKEGAEAADAMQKTTREDNKTAKSKNGLPPA